MELTQIYCPVCGKPIPIEQGILQIPIHCRCQTAVDVQELSRNKREVSMFFRTKEQSPKDFLLNYLSNTLENIDTSGPEWPWYKKVLDWERNNSIPYWTFPNYKIKDALMEILRENSIVVLTSRLNAFLQNLLIEDSDLYKEEEELCGDCFYKIDDCVCPTDDSSYDQNYDKHGNEIEEDEDEDEEDEDD